MKLKIISFDRYFKRATFELLEDVNVAGITVPAGSITDGMSVPRWLVVLGLLILISGIVTSSIGLIILGVLVNLQTTLFPTFGSYSEAVLVHDVFFEKGEYARANTLMNEIMIHSNTPFLKRKYIMAIVNIYKHFK